MTRPGYVRSRIMVIIGVCVLVASFSLWWLYGSSSPQSVNEQTKVRIGVQGNSSSALVLIAANAGYFSRHGITAELKRYPSGKLAYKGLLAGEVDVCTVADMPIMSHGTKVNARILTSISTTRQGCWITARRDRGISTVEDLRGKRIGTQKNSAVHFFLSMLLLENNISESECELVFMKAVDLPGALIDGTIDAFSMRNPFASQAKKVLENRIVEFSSSVYLQHFLLVADRTWMDANQEGTRHILSALSNAEITLTKQDEAIDLVANELPGTDKEEIESDWSKLRIGLSLDHSLILTLEAQAAWAKHGDMSNANFLDIIETKPLKSVRPNVVRLKE